MSKKDDSSSGHEKSDIEAAGAHGVTLPELAGDAKTRELDEALTLPGMVGKHDDDELDPVESRRVKRKLDKHIISILLPIYCLQYMDKSVIASSAILGFLPDNKLSIEQLNNLNSFFYVGVLIGQWPHAYALQKLPVGKYLGVMMLTWSILVGMHCVAGNYGNLAAIRVLLGLTEGCITPGVMLICSMYYTRTEMGERVGWTFNCNGIALILTGFISFGAYHTPMRTPTNGIKVAQWQWFMIIIALLTFIYSWIFLWFCPDSPTKAKFLTEQEKIIVIKRMRANQTGSETKVWKKDQFMEALKDPKAYLFMLFAILINFVGGIGVQFSLIIKDFGFSILQTTLLGMPNGIALIVGVTTAVYFLRLYPNGRMWIAAISYTPSIIAAILLIALPDGRIGLLISFYFMQLGNNPAAVLSLNWITATTSGHTKKLTLHGMWFIGYSIGQIVSPQWWKNKYKPRNRVPWAILLAAFCCEVLLVIYLRFYFNRLNKIRDAAAAVATGEEAEKYSEYGYIEVPDKDAPGGTRRVQVEKRFLDLTDQQNLNFRYVL